MTKKKQPPQLSPVEYIRTKARLLPIYKCYINSYWIEAAMAGIVIARQHKNGNFTIGVYFVDTFRRGLFKSAYFFSKDESFLENLKDNMVSNVSDRAMVVEIDYALTHNIIYGSIAFASTQGFKPIKDFEISKYLLEEDDGKIEHIDITFGKNEGREQEEKENDDKESLDINYFK